MISSKAQSFDVAGKKYSYLGTRFFTMGLGLGFSAVQGYQGISGNGNFSFDLSVGHEISHDFFADFTYKFGLVGVVTPSPIDTSTNVDSTIVFHSEALRLFYKCSSFNFQPFIFAGIGIYNFTSVDSKTGMDFPLGLQFPVGTGVLWYVYKNQLSLRFSFEWHFLLGENQNQNVLNALNTSKVSFDVFSTMMALTWHIW